jgi:transglutaminase-like putative cysteine protease
LGTGSIHSQAVLFTVKAPAEALNLPRLYWRGVVYDRYDDGEWASTAPGSAVFRPADQRLPLADYETLPAARYTFTSNTGGRLLYTPTSAVWVSRASNLRYFPVEVRSMDIQSILAQQLFLRGETYYVRAPLRNPTVADLRAAPRNYPDWVTQTYLQLPEDLPPEIEQLAEEITRDGVNPYDRALAITNYLRGGMVYMERIPSPPASSDPIAWFLFEGKQGFCNYYASAEVLMLRSIGIPARLVAGFSQGEKNSTGSTFTVREKNAHAWPEAYFPGFGWIEFEPTANQPALARPPGLTRLGTGPLTPVAPPQGELRPDPVDLEVPAGRPTPVGPNIAAVAAWLVGLVVAVVLFVSLRRRGPNRPPVVRQASVGLRDFLKARNLPAPAWLDDWVLWLQMPAIEQSFQAINQALSWLGRQQPVHATPAERAATLQRILPEADQPIGSLLEELHAHVFSPKPGNVARATHAARRVRYLALRRWVSRLFKRDNI